MIKNIFLVLTLTLACVVFASGCNTVRGMGQDLEKGGKQLQEISTR